jgi:hypothetical protein
VGYTVTVGNAFFASINNEPEQNDVEALEAGDVKNTLCILKQFSNNLEATRDMINDRVLFININADPGATSKHKSFTNDILRNDVTPGVADRGGSATTHMYFKLCEEQCLKATLGASAKLQADKYLSTGGYGNGGGAGNTMSSSTTTAKSPSPRMGRISNRHKKERHHDNNTSPHSKPKEAS